MGPMWAIIMLAVVAGVAVALLITVCIVQARKRARADANVMNTPLVDVESSAGSYRRSPDGSLPTRSTMTKSRGDKLK